MKICPTNKDGVLLKKNVNHDIYVNSCKFMSFMSNHVIYVAIYVIHDVIYVIIHVQWS
jgi:hypothetical protein